jgi:hypothetical protein
MEGAGAAAAIEAAHANGLTVGFVMIRGISDMPGMVAGSGTDVRDGWKRFAADAAACFLIEVLTTRWPASPQSNSGDAEEAFDLAQPIEIDRLRAIAEDVSRIREHQERVRLETAPNQIGNLLHALESRNPGFKFEARSTTVGTEFHVRADSRLELSAPSFPDTPAGRRGAEKFRLFIEEGRAVELLSDEYEWTSPIVDDGLIAPEGAERSLRLEPKIPTHNIPVALHWIDAGGRDREIVALTFLRANRIGSREIEIRLAGGRLAGEFSIVASQTSEGPNTLGFSLDLPSVGASDAHATLQLLFWFAGPGTLVIVDAEQGFKLFAASGMSGDVARLDKLKGALSLTEDLATLNRELGKSFRYPEAPISREDDQAADLLASAVECGGPIAVPSPGQVALLFGIQDARDALATWRTSALTLQGKRTEPFKLFGQSISTEELGGVDMYLDNSAPIESINVLAERIDSTEDGQAISVPVRVERELYDFPKWHRKST